MDKVCHSDASLLMVPTRHMSRAINEPENQNGPSLRMINKKRRRLISTQSAVAQLIMITANPFTNVSCVFSPLTKIREECIVLSGNGTAHTVSRGKMPI